MIRPSGTSPTSGRMSPDGPQLEPPWESTPDLRITTDVITAYTMLSQSIGARHSVHGAHRREVPPCSEIDDHGRPAVKGVCGSTKEVPDELRERAVRRYRESDPKPGEVNTG